MSRRLIAINAALALFGVVAGVYAVRELRAPAPTVTRRPPPTPVPVASPVTPSPTTAPGSYGVVAGRNLFSPNRSEAPADAPTASAQPAPKPHLYGIILRDEAPVAYLEDPATKRVAGYRLGDVVAGGTLKQITKDHVVLNRAEGDVNVRLRDPSKPRPAAPPVAPGAPQPMPTQIPGVPGVPAQPQSGQSAPQLGPGQLPVLPRRPIPPNVLRRLPPQPVPDAQPQN